MKLAIIIPAYNEERRIGMTLETYTSFFNFLAKEGRIDYKIIVAINGTTDSTEAIVKKFMRKNRNVLYLNLKKGGKGFAVIEGFKQALKLKFDLIGFVDADMATSPENFFVLAENLGKYDGIIASRYMDGSVVNPKPTFQRILVSRVYNALIRTLFLLPYKDTQCGAKIFKNYALDKTINTLQMAKWAFDLDLLYHLRKNGFKIKEYPTVWSDKKYSKINFLASGPLMALAVIRLRIINSPFRRFIRIYDSLLEALL